MQILAPRDESPVDQLRLGGMPIEREAHFRLIFDRKHVVSYILLNESDGNMLQIAEMAPIICGLNSQADRARTKLQDRHGK